jgi:hypothetical protein
MSEGRNARQFRIILIFVNGSFLASKTLHIFDENMDLFLFRVKVPGTYLVRGRLVTKVTGTGTTSMVTGYLVGIPFQSKDMKN